jgi:6-phosphofructokinase
VIRAATRAAILEHKWKVIGIPDGFDGLIWPEKSFELTLDRVSGILPRGGTILGTTNRGNPFHYKIEDNGQQVVRDISDQVIANSKKLGIDAIITIGGDGSQKIGYELFQTGMKIVGVPKTIDNDLSATELTFGFDTALHTVSDAIDKIHATAASHYRVMVVEVMGRDCGWIALAGGIAGGAHIILIPEIPFTIKSVGDFIAQRELGGRDFTIVVVAEGVKQPPEFKENRREPAWRFRRHPDRQRHRRRIEQGSAGQRAGTHSARRIAFTVRPRAGHAFRRRRSRIDCRRRVRKDGGLARQFDRRRRHGQGHWTLEGGAARRRIGAHGPRDRDRIRGLSRDC